MPDFNDGIRHPCCLYFNNDVVEVNSSDGTIEDTTVTGDIANGVLSTLEIDIISTSVTFTIDGVVVATHSTRRPDRVLQFMAGSRNTNSIAPQMEISYVEVWGVE